MHGERAFAKIRIDAVRMQRLGDISDAEVHAEGYKSREEYLTQYVTGRKVPEPIEDVEVYVLEFHVVERYEPVPPPTQPQ